MKTFTYRWLHIPTSTGGVRTIEFINRESFLSFLNGCNRCLPGHWQYWEV
jgi:hypothetical protein